MKNSQTLSRYAAVAVGTLVLAMLMAGPSVAHDIIAEWATAKPPPVPELKPVTLDPQTTALLILDMMKFNCGPRPRCIATVPPMKQLQDRARAAGAMVFYVLLEDNPTTPAEVIDSGLAPREGEWVVRPGPDKFLGTGLDERLKARGIKTVVVCGTTAQGAVLGAGNGAALRGYRVIVPVDCMSSQDPYEEQYAAWHMFKGGPPPVVSKTTLTRTHLIKF